MAATGASAGKTGAHGGPEPTRRDFLYIATGAMAAVGAAAAAWPFIDQWNPSADALALSTTDVTLTPIAEGQTVTVFWQGKPTFVRHRTAAEIKEAEDTPMSDLPDPQADKDRVKPNEAEWLVVIGVCTHLGCVPVSNAGDFGGWFCPCHGSHYDTSGRIRKGPAPANLPVPTYAFTSPTTIRIG
ncbi:ubiquinol-cytochrome c reductase iron-sulfur subunit [Zavarzinia sp. CC-PAN008]|uniref:ubiquinol-cytochrome c reductase iron-sulfur subunit n=1 Tax=Zavarzinia sp. CC-PAN008 TaxID=3243332 RepID=UPI003F746CF0